jgi:hypothetical protein
MKIEFHNNLGNPQSVEVTRVVVYDQHDNPVAVAVEVEPGAIITGTAEHADFNELLRGLGLNKTVVVQTVEQVPLREIKFPK